MAPPARDVLELAGGYWISVDARMLALPGGDLSPGWLVDCHRACHPELSSAVCEVSRPAAGGGRRLESPDQGDDGARGRVQCEHHGDTRVVEARLIRAAARAGARARQAGGASQRGHNVPGGRNEYE